MGSIFEVHVWDRNVSQSYYWMQIYSGTSIIKAIYNMWWAKKNNWKCIKLEWRPQ